jgi:hypothetical protein
MNCKLGYLSKTVLIFIITIVIGGCASIKTRYENQLSVKPGTEIIINLVAKIPFNQARVYSQKGQVILRSDVDKSDVFCSFLMNSLQTKNGHQLAIVPGKFRVTRVKLWNDNNYGMSIFLPKKRFYDPPSYINYETELRLDSVDQPDVRSLICVRIIDDYGDYYPQLSDFKKALGSLVKFND